MKKIVLLSVLGFGCAFADAADTTDVVTNEAAVNEQVNCDCDGKSFDGFLFGLGGELGWFGNNLRFERFERDGVFYHMGSEVLNKKKFTAGANVVIGARKMFGNVLTGLECACTVGAKNKVSDDEHGIESKTSAFVPGVSVLFASYNDCLRGLVGLTFGASFVRHETDFYIVDEDGNKGAKDCTRKKTVVYPVVGLRFEKVIGMFHNKKVLGQVGVEYTFGKRKEMENGGEPFKSTFSSRFSKVVVKLGASVNI